MIAFITPDEKMPVTILPTIKAIDAAGHTPGHVIFLINGDTLFAGDLLHSDLLQFAHPEICATFDNDKEAAVAMRRKILTRAAEENWDFIASHVPKSGRIEKDGDGFRLVAEE
jgi:glyoxylase-like metal-dependent hydrolase (beta-lactamase superfamily II)